MGEVAEVKRQEVAPAEPAPANDLAVIERLIHDPSVDVAKVNSLFEIREKMLARQAQLDFNAALKKAKATMPSVFRNKKNTQTDSKYADLESVSKAMDPVITDNGFALSFGTADSPLADHYRIVCVLSHEGGHEKEYQADIPVDKAGIKGTQNKTLTHAFGSTMSYGRRYLKMMIFDVATSDDDGNKAGPDTITDEQSFELELLIGHAKADKAAFLKMCGVERLEDLPATKFAGAKKRLEAKRDAQ